MKHRDDGGGPIAGGLTESPGGDPARPVPCSIPVVRAFSAPADP